MTGRFSRKGTQKTTQRLFQQDPLTAALRRTMPSGGSSALAVIGTGRVLRRQYGGQLTMAASSNSTAASCISELLDPCCLSSSRSACDPFRSIAVVHFFKVFNKFAPKADDHDADGHPGPGGSFRLRAGNPA